jgi:hypothetical protein
MLRNAMTDFPGDRFQDQSGDMFRFKLASVYMVISGGGGDSIQFYLLAESGSYDTSGCCDLLCNEEWASGGILEGLKASPRTIVFSPQTLAQEALPNLEI